MFSRGYKARMFFGLCGTTELVPCYRALECVEQVGPEDNCRCFDSSARRTSLNMTAFLSVRLLVYHLGHELAGIPQGLKARMFLHICGTTEVVPCYKAPLNDLSASCEVVTCYKSTVGRLFSKL
jgi:hypothetical protein